MSTSVVLTMWKIEQFVFDRNNIWVRAELNMANKLNCKLD